MSACEHCGQELPERPRLSAGDMRQGYRAGRFAWYRTERSEDLLGLYPEKPGQVGTWIDWDNLNVWNALLVWDEQLEREAELYEPPGKPEAARAFEGIDVSWSLEACLEDALTGLDGVETTLAWAHHLRELADKLERGADRRRAHLAAFNLADYMHVTHGDPPGRSPRYDTITALHGLAGVGDA